MESNGVIAKGSARKKALPIFLVAVMAIAVFLVAWFARADECCIEDYCCFHPLSVEKKLETGVVPNDDVSFRFQLFLSPRTANNSDSALRLTDHVHGVVYNADGTLDRSVNRVENGVLYPATFRLQDDRSIIFELKAGQKVLFDLPENCEGVSFNECAVAGWDDCTYQHLQLPFDPEGAGSGIFVLNELIGPDSEASQAKFAFSGATITGGSVYEGETVWAWEPYDTIENEDGTYTYVYARYDYEYETFDEPRYWDWQEGAFKVATENENGNLGGYVTVEYDDGYTYTCWENAYERLEGVEDLAEGVKYKYWKYVPVETNYYDCLQYWDEERNAFMPADKKKISQLIVDKFEQEMGIIGKTATSNWVYVTYPRSEWVSVAYYGSGDSRCRYTKPDEVRGDGRDATYVYGDAEFDVPQYLNPDTEEFEPAQYWDREDGCFKDAQYGNEDEDSFPQYHWGGLVRWEEGEYVAREDVCAVTVYNSNYRRRPITITKTLEDNAVADDTFFNFTLTVSPDQLGKSGEAVPNGTKIGDYVVLDENGDQVSSFAVDSTLQNQQISFSLKANWSITFYELPFSTFDVDGEDDFRGTYTIEELGIRPDENSKATYSFSNIDCPSKVEVAASGVLGAAQGALSPDGDTVVTVANRQDTPSEEPQTPSEKSGTVTISKALEGVEGDNTEFTFEMIVSPEWKNTVSLGYPESLTLEGIIYDASDGNEVAKQTYAMTNNTVSDIKLKAGQRIVFKDVPYLSEEGKPGTIIVNEWLKGDVANTYALKSYEVVTGDEIGFDAASEIKIMNTSDALSTLLAPAGATETTVTGVYGEMAGGEFNVAFTNGSAHEDGAYGLSIIKSLANFRFDKYASANVVFKVYKFETKEACDAYFDEASEDFGNAENVKWQSVLAMRMTENGEQKAELSGLTEGYYAIEEFSATNMSSAGFTRRFVQISADDPVGKQFEVRFANTFEDQNLYENSIVNTYKKVIDKDGNIKWQRYQDGKPVGDPVASR